MACFGDLSHDGTADCDHDGLTDRAEFLAGTDPLNQGSVLRVLRLTSINGGSTTLLWSAVAGRSYRAQYKDSLSASTWNECATAVTATTTTAVYTDDAPNAFGQRFYRVTVAP